jgi:outer membrane protein assembly factor BamB
MVAIRADGKGDVTKTGAAWQSDNGGPDICTPLSDGRNVYVLDTSGMLTVLNLSDGKLVYQQTIEASFKASPSLVGQEIYLLSEKGVLIRVTAGSTFKELGRCELGDTCYASPTFADGRMILRGKEYLYCIGK